MKATITNTINIDKDNKGKVDFAQSINFTELFTQIQGLTKVKCEFEKPEISITRGNVYIKFYSNDIAEQTGAFAAILKECYFYSFSNGVTTDKETNEMFYWVSVTMQYQHKDGGSNGMEVTTATYTEKNGWHFRNVGSR
jgi:hypothetical protein